jgi:hypothetical protein
MATGREHIQHAPEFADGLNGIHEILETHGFYYVSAGAEPLVFI